VQASKEWQWLRCYERNRLLIDLGDELQLCTPYRLYQLTGDSESNPNFCIDDAEYYQNVFFYLQNFKVWTDAQCCQIALNATAAKFHLKPMLAKSWFFNEYTGNADRTEAIVALSSSVQTGEFFIVECDLETSLCISLNETFKLDEHLTLEPFQAIRVLNNRIQLLMFADKNIKSA
jgi:cell division protein ZapC